MTEQGKPHQITIAPGRPLDIQELDPAAMPTGAPQIDPLAARIASAVKQYVLAARELTADKFPHLSGIVPAHLSSPGRIIVICMPDGVLIRHESREGEIEVLAARSPDSALQLVPAITEQVVHIVQTETPPDLAELPGPTLNLTAVSPSTGGTSLVLSARIGFLVRLQPPPPRSSPSAKPFSLFSVNNSIELGLEGEFFPDQDGIHAAMPFIVRSKLRMPVGWQCVEFFPELSPEAWNPDNAPSWAENDILAAAVAHQTREAQFFSLDPSSEARSRFSRLFDQFKALLETDPLREEELFLFLRAHPQILCPTMIRCWPKLALGATQTDFVFRSAVGSYLLVEIEPATERLFRADGHPTARLNHARDQVRDWKRYIEDNLHTVQHELGLSTLTANPQALVVIGRSKELTEPNRRTLTAMSSETPNVIVITYDDLLAQGKQVIENILGPLWVLPGDTKVYYPQPPSG